MDDETFSRRVNEFFGGSPDEMFCARCWRRRWFGWWPVVWWIDIRFMHLRGEPMGHCRRTAAYERRSRLPADPVTQARWAGLL